MKKLRSVFYTLLGLLLLLLSLMAVGDVHYKIEPLSMPEKNPTSYIFAGDSAKVTAAIRAADAKGAFGRVSLELAIDSKVLWGRDILTRPANNRDAYLHHRDLDTSRVYTRDGGKGVVYYIAHHLHLTPVDGGRTRVEVIAIRPEILTGYPWNFFGVTHPSPYTEHVPPSTIEEYEILLAIGREFGMEKDMPPLKLPHATP